MTRTTNKKFIGLVSLAVTAILAVTLSVGIGLGVNAQVPTAISQLGGPECGTSGTGVCTDGTVHLVNARTLLTTSEAAADRDENLQFTRPGGQSVDADLDYVGDGRTLYGSFLTRDDATVAPAKIVGT